jgi:hypothetical protein
MAIAAGSTPPVYGSETAEEVIVMSDVLIERFRTLDPARPIQQPPFHG